MRSNRFVALTLLVLATGGLAGCTLPGRSNEATAAPQGLASPPAGCAHLNVTGNPVVLHPGESMAIVVNVTNSCAQPFQIQARNGCEHDGVDLGIMQDQTMWLFRGPDAANARACPKVKGDVVAVPPGGSHRVVLVWDGTVTDAYCQQQDKCNGTRLLPTGSYVLVATLLGDVARAETTVRIYR
jgi:hypothetical protein